MRKPQLDWVRLFSDSCSEWRSEASAPQVRPAVALEAGQEHSASAGDGEAWMALGPGGAAGLGIQQTGPAPPGAVKRH